MANIKFLQKSNMVSDAATVMGSSEVNMTDLPPKNVIDDVKGRKWRTGRNKGHFRVWVGGPDRNDYLDVNIGSGEQTVQLTRGEYSAADLATEVQTQLRTLSATISCSYSKSTGKFTVSKTSGTLQLLGSTGTNVANSIWADMGYSATDHTGALSYESDSKALHMDEFVQLMFGTVTIRDAATVVSGVSYARNDKLNFKESSTGDELTATIPPGTYSVQELCVEAEYQMELAGANDYSITHDVNDASGTGRLKTRKVKITTDGSFLSLLWKTGANGSDNTGEAWNLAKLLGVDDATPADDTGATSYLLDHPVFPNREDEQVTLAGIFGHNIASSATVQLRGRRAADIFLLDSSLEGLNNPATLMTFSVAFRSNYKVKPGNVDLGNGIMVT